MMKNSKQAINHQQQQQQSIPQQNNIAYSLSYMQQQNQASKDQINQQRKQERYNQLNPQMQKQQTDNIQQIKDLRQIHQKNLDQHQKAKIQNKQLESSDSHPQLIENASQPNNLFHKKQNMQGMSSMILESQGAKKRHTDMEMIDFGGEDSNEMIIDNNKPNQNKIQKYSSLNKHFSNQNQIFSNGFDDQLFQDPMPDEDGFLGSFMNQQPSNNNLNNPLNIFESEQHQNNHHRQNKQNFNHIDFFGHDNDQEEILEGNLSDHFGSQLMIMGGGGAVDDLNKIHQNFAGDTFSQISSTYEQQQQQQVISNKVLSGGGQSVKHSSQTNYGIIQSLTNNQQSQLNENGQSNNIYHYQQKNRPSTKVKMHHHNNDELLDSMILNNLNDEMNTQREQTNTNKHQNMIMNRNGNQIIEFKSHKQSNNNKMLGYPSSHSNLKNIIMNSEQLQQSDNQSTMTIYNSGIFDDASIMKILDKSISDDSLFIQQQQHLIDEINNQKNQSQAMKSSGEVEQSFVFECEDVKQILANLSSKCKEKVQKQRMNGSQMNNQQPAMVTISIDELKSYEILATSAIEKVRQIQSIGSLILESQKMKSLSFKKYKENLKIKVHNQVKKFKDVCKKQVRQTENWKFKYQINEFETNEKIQQIEEKFDRQSDEINKLANKCEQLKYEKDCLARKNEKKLNDMEKIVKVVIKTLSGQEHDRLTKINNSFCVGAADHSMLLQPRSKRKFHLGKLGPTSTDIYLQQHQQQQQSVDDKENESILSNQGVKIDNREIKSYLEKVKNIIKENRKYNQIFLRKGPNGSGGNRQGMHQQEQEGGSCYQSSQIIQGFNEHDNQQSQFIPDEGDLEINKAFIDNENESNSTSSKNRSCKPYDKMIDITEESIDYEFDQNQVLVVMDGKPQNDNLMEESKKSLEKLLDIKDIISSQDLKGQVKHHFDKSPSERQIIQFKRERMLKGSGLERFEDSQDEEQKHLPQLQKNGSSQVHQNQLHHNHLLNFSQDNSIDADLEILGNLQKNGNNLKMELNNLSNDEDLSCFLNDDNFKKSEFNGEGGLAMASISGGKNILVFDDFNGGALGSRNQVMGNLYSGGSSQLSMIQAFPNSNRIAISNDVIIVKVLDRRIPIPKLNMHAVHRRDKIELFDKNIPDIENTELSITQSEIHQTSLSNHQNNKNNINNQANNTNTNNINLVTDPQNITSFQNESISKQYQNSSCQIDHTNSSGNNKLGDAFDFGYSNEGMGAAGGNYHGNLLDQAIYHDSQSKQSNFSVSSNKQGKNIGYGSSTNAGQNPVYNQNMQNMFDSFKQELGMLDSIKKISGSNETFDENTNINKNSTNQKKLLDQTLDLDDGSLDRDKNQVIFNQEFKDQFQSQQNKDFYNQNQNDFNLLDLSHDKSGDISANANKFKKSLSDPNLMFNDVDSDNENQSKIPNSKTKNQQSQKQQNLQISSQNQPLIQNKNLLENMKKLKTPQSNSASGSNLFKFNEQLQIAAVGITKNGKGEINSKAQIDEKDEDGVILQREEKQSQATQGNNLNSNSIVRKSLGQFQANLRKSISNSRKSQDEHLQSQQLGSQGHQKDSFEISNIDAKQSSKGSNSNPQTLNQSKNIKNCISQNSPAQSTSPQLMKSSQTNKNILRAISSNSGQTSDLDSQGIPEPSDHHSSIHKQSQLIQNYMQGAATMNGGSSNSQLSKSSISKLLNPTRKNFHRNQVHSSQSSQQDDGQKIQGFQQVQQQFKLNPNNPLQKLQNIAENNRNSEQGIISNQKEIHSKSILQEMKEHLECQDLNNQDKNFLRKKKNNVTDIQQNIEKINTENCDETKLDLSPSAKRQSQSHTPKKREMIIVSNQQIKLGPKIKFKKANGSSIIFNSNNESQINMTMNGGVNENPVANQNENQQISTSVVRQSLPSKKITIQRKIINKKAQNISVADQSIDQSQMIQPRLGSQQNETFITGNPDNSIMINDISVIQPAGIGSLISKTNILKGLRKKSQLAKINPGSILTKNNLNQSTNQQTQQTNVTNQSIILPSNNNNISQLNQSIANNNHNISASKISMNNQGNQNAQLLQVKNIVSALPNQNFISQQIIDKIKKQKIESQQQSANINHNSGPCQNNAINTSAINLANYHSNPVNSSAPEGPQVQTLIKDQNTQSNERLIKIPQRMMIMNPSLIQQQKLVSQQKILNKNQQQVNLSSNVSVVHHQNDQQSSMIIDNNSGNFFQSQNNSNLNIDKNYHSVKLNSNNPTNIQIKQANLANAVNQTVGTIANPTQIQQQQQSVIKRSDEGKKLQNRRREIIEKAALNSKIEQQQQDQQKQQFQQIPQQYNSVNGRI